jgi:NADH-quinone oxidoreductase subunit M
VMFGNVTNPANEHLPDLNAREYATLLPLVALAFWIGIYPKPLFEVLDVPVHRLVERVNPNYFKPAPSTASIATMPAPATAANPSAALAAATASGTHEAR